MRKVVSYLTLGCNDLDQAVAFYDPVLGALGLNRLWLQNGWAGYGPDGDDHGTVLLCPPFDEQPARAVAGPAVLQPQAAQAQSPQHRVVEGRRLVQVIAADGEVADHLAHDQAAVKMAILLPVGSRR